MLNYKRTYQTGGRKIYTSGRCVGSIKNGILYKRIRFSRHALKYPAALAFSKTSLAEAQKSGCTVVEIYDEESSRIYRASLQKILEEGFEIQRGGYERQIALLITAWDVSFKRLVDNKEVPQEDEFDSWS